MVIRLIQSTKSTYFRVWSLVDERVRQLGLVIEDRKALCTALYALEKTTAPVLDTLYF
jgi:hypothetical protein